MIFAYSDISIRVVKGGGDHVKAGTFCAMTGEDAIYNDLEKLEGSCWSCYIPVVNNHVATYVNPHPFWVVLLGAYLAHYFCVRDFFSSVRRYIFISNDPECFSSR